MSASVATARTISLQGPVGHLIEVQVHVGDGLVGTSLVGRPDASISEARDRCRSALVTSGLTWPSTRRVTILLSPADLPKRGPHFDLAIAVGVLAASGQVSTPGLADSGLIGELTLDGALRTVPGVLPMAMAAAAAGLRRVLVPEPQVAEAALVPGLEVIGARSLGQVVAVLSGKEIPEAPPVPAVAGVPSMTWLGANRLVDVDLADLAGLTDEKFAVEVAAAGGHHLLLTGPKGAGKTSIAERIPGLLPDLTVEEALELTAVHSLAGTLGVGGLIRRPPFLAPHHSATRASLLGGGTGKVRPGELSRAHCGVLLLDEFPLLSSDILEALRQPLESGEITLARGEETATYPARGMVVLACNPCPCGNYGVPVTAGGSVAGCQCAESSRRGYLSKLSGPIADRIDITRHVVPAPGDEDPFGRRDTTAEVRERVACARARQAERYAGRSWRLNAHAPWPVLLREWPLVDGATETLDGRLREGQLTRRGAARVHRLAWTVADLAGLDAPGPAELDVALRLRCGQPLLDATVRVAG